MGWRRDDRDYGRGGYDRRGGYGDRGYGGGWGGGYEGRRDFNRFDNHGSQFDIGQKVLHIATGTELSVIGFGREQIECRKPDLNTVWVYEHEIEPIKQ